MTRTTGALALAAALGLAAPAVAQDMQQPDEATPGQATQMPEAMPVDQIDDAKLASFVTAAEAIRGVLDRFGPQMQQAQTDTERADLEEAINEEIVKAVEEVDGITLQEYVRIARTARQNEALDNRTTEMMGQG